MSKTKKQIKLEQIKPQLTPLLIFCNAQLSEDNYQTTLNEIVSTSVLSSRVRTLLNLNDHPYLTQKGIKIKPDNPGLWASSDPDLWQQFPQNLGFKIEFDLAQPLTYIRTAQRWLQSLLDLILLHPGPHVIAADRLRDFFTYNKISPQFKAIIETHGDDFAWTLDPYDATKLDLGLCVILADFILRYPNWRDYLGKCPFCGTYFVKPRPDQKYDNPPVCGNLYRKKSPKPFTDA